MTNFLDDLRGRGLVHAISDDDVERFGRMLTLEATAAIDEVLAAHAGDPAKRVAQRFLAESVTRFVHGDEALATAQRTTEVLFNGGDLRGLGADALAAAFRTAPGHTVPRSALGTADAALVKVLADAGLYKSRSEAKTAVTQGGASVNGVVVSELQRVLGVDDVLHGGFIVLRKGRKTWHVVRLAD